MSRITVFTPTYNRAYCLGNCYESLKRQTCKDFEWLIVDDGSTDQTEDLVAKWQAETNDFKIRYRYKSNGGLHTAYNEAIANTESELCMCVDSDDCVPETAIERILVFWDERGSDAVAGIVGLDYTVEGELIGDPLPEEPTINLIDLLTGKYRIHNGDRTLVLRTVLYKKVAPMKVFAGEKNFNPHYMHLQISQLFDFLVLNESLKIVNYQADGMSANLFQQYYNSPKSFAETRKLYLGFPNTSVKFRFRHAIHYVSSSLISRNICFLKEVSCKCLVILAIPFGVLLTAVIYWKNSQKRRML